MASVSADLADLIAYYEIHPVPQRYNAAIVCASFAVSCLGSYTTLLLLGRRTSKPTFKNFLLLVLAAATMASVGIWGMHFVGMHMSLKASPTVKWYLLFNPAWTVFSLFVPLVALVGAFIFLGSQTRLSLWRIILCGLIFGGIVATMHYSAGFSANFRVTYAPGQTVASIILACSATTGALLIFFNWRAQWEDVWWKRLCCALILASGVCSMHYCAVGGTSYYVRPERIGDLTSGKRTGVVITSAISAMCGLLCVLSIGFVVQDTLSTQETRKRTRQIIVASACFDKEGNLLVKPDGTLPYQLVQTDDMPKDMLAELNLRKPTFQWLFSLSCDWHILDPFVDRIASRAFGLHRSLLDSEKAASAELGEHAGAFSAFTSTRNAQRMAGIASFRDRFIQCCFLLGHELGLSYQNVGLMFDTVVSTGTHRTTSVEIPSEGDEKDAQADDVASTFSTPVISLPGEGAMLVLVRAITETGSDRVSEYIEKGFRFGETRFLAPVLASRFGMDRKEMSGLLSQLQTHAKRAQLPIFQPSGIYLGMFAVRPNGTDEVDALVYSFSRTQIPAYRVPHIGDLTPTIRQWISDLNGATLADVRAIAFRQAFANEHLLRAQTANTVSSRGTFDPMAGDPVLQAKRELTNFQSSLFIAIDTMIQSLRMFEPFQFQQRAVLSAEILDMPTCPNDLQLPAHMLLFNVTVPPVSPSTPRTLILPDYGSSFARIPPFTFTPVSLFAKAQSASVHGRAASDFKRQVRAELIKRYPGVLKGDIGLGSPHPALQSDAVSESDDENQEGERMADSRRSKPPFLGYVSGVWPSSTRSRLWERSPEGIDIEKGVIGEKASEEKVDIPLKLLKSPVILEKQDLANAEVSSGDGHGSSIASDDIKPIQPESPNVDNFPRTPERSAAQAGMPSTGSSNWVTPPPAFLTKEVTYTPTSIPPSFTSAPPSAGSASDQQNASSALLAAANVGTPRSPPNYRSPPPTIPLPATPPTAHVRSMKPRHARSTSGKSSGAKSGRWAALRSAFHSTHSRDEAAKEAVLSHHNGIVKKNGQAPRRAATAARLQSDSWYFRALDEIEGGRNGADLQGCKW